MIFVLKLMDFVLKMMIFVLKLMDFVLKMMNLQSLRMNQTAWRRYNDAFCINNIFDAFWITIDEFVHKNDQFCIENDELYRGTGALEGTGWWRYASKARAAVAICSEIDEFVYYNDEICINNVDFNANIKEKGGFCHDAGE